MERYLGIDIGGTKTAVVLGSVEGRIGDNFGGYKKCEIYQG